MRLSFRHLTGGVVGALLLPLASAIPAQAVLVNVGSATYDVSFTTTSQNLSSALFAATAPGQMPWWGDPGLASATAVPAPLPLLGVTAAFGGARRLRSNRNLIIRKVSRLNQGASRSPLGHFLRH